jgi:hypothetical protein
MVLLKAHAPNLVARYNVSRRLQPKWVYRHVRAPTEFSGSTVSLLNELGTDADFQELKKSYLSAMGKDVNPEYLVYNEVGHTSQGNDSELTDRSLLGLVPTVTSLP